MKDFQNGDEVIHDELGIGKIFKTPNDPRPSILYVTKFGNISALVQTQELTGWSLLEDSETFKESETTKNEATATVEIIDGVQYVTVSVPCPDCPNPVERVLKMYPTSFNGGWDMSLESKKVDPTTGDRHHTCKRPVFEEPENNGSLVMIRDEFGKKRRLVKRSGSLVDNWVDVGNLQVFSWQEIVNRVISLDWK